MLLTDFFLHYDNLNAPAVFDLISKGKVYPTSHSFHQTGKIIYRKLTAADELLLSEPLFKIDPYQVNGVLEKTILNNDNPKISIDDMLVCDRDLMILNHRISIYGVQFPGVVLKCKDCQQGLNTELLGISNVEDKFLEIDPCIEGTNKFLWKDKKFEIIFQFPTVKAWASWDNTRSTQGHLPLKDWIEHTVLEVNNAKSTREIIETLRHEPGSVKRFRSFYFNHLPQKTFVTTPLICPNCKTDNTIHSKIDVDTLPFKTSNFKEVCLEEYVYAMKEMRIGWDDLVTMPIETRKRLMEKYAKMNKKPEETIPNRPQ